jgi:hypothetical protein
LADSASLVTAVWGLRYKPYIARWWDSVKTLNRKPDEIVLATTLDDPCELLNSIPDWLDIPIIKVQVESEEHNIIFVEAAKATTKDWIVGMPIDDQYHPQALDFIESVDGDLVIDNCQFLQGGEWIPTWDLSDTHNRRFAPAGIGPYRRNLLPLFIECNKEAYWNDMVFYLLAVKQGVKTYRTQNYRMIHDLGHDHETMSGYNSDSVKRAWADDQLVRIRQELGL